MANITGSKWFQKSRINVDSDLYNAKTIGKCVFLEGDNASIQLGDIYSFLFFIEKIDTFTTNDTIYCNGDNENPTNNGIHIKFTSASNIRIKTPNDISNNISITALKLNVKYQFGLYIDTNLTTDNVYVFVNGKLDTVASIDFSNIGSSTSPVIIGHANSAAINFSIGGNISNFIIIKHPTSITQDQFIQLCNYSYVNGGILHSDYHSAVIFHMPFQGAVSPVIDGINYIARDGGWDTGSFSNESFTGDGGITFYARNKVTAAAIGLSDSDVDQTQLTIDYAFQVRASDFLILENGTNKKTVSGRTFNDKLEIRRTGTTITFYVNDVLEYTSLITTSAALFIDTSHNSSWVVFDRLKFNDGAIPTWSLFNGAIEGRNMTFDVVEQYNYAKLSGAITAVADASLGNIRASAAAHGMLVGQQVNITDTSSYNDTYTITNINDVGTFDVSATFVATETGNWDQTLTANNGVLVNYTDDELGIVNPSSQTAIKDFYTKNLLNNKGFFFTGVENGTMTSATSIDISGNWTFSFVYNPIERPYNTAAGYKSICWSGVSASTLFLVRTYVSGTFDQVIDFQFWWTQGSANVSKTFLTYSDADLIGGQDTANRNINISIRKTGTLVEYFFNGVKVDESTGVVFDVSTLQSNTTWGSRDTGSEKLDNVSLGRTQWHSVALPRADIININKGNTIDANLVFRHNWDASGFVIDEVGTHDITLSGNPTKTIEFKSIMPPRLNALKKGKYIWSLPISLYPQTQDGFIHIVVYPTEPVVGQFIYLMSVGNSDLSTSTTYIAYYETISETIYFNITGVASLSFSLPKELFFNNINAFSYTLEIRGGYEINKLYLNGVLMDSNTSGGTDRFDSGVSFVNDIITLGWRTNIYGIPGVSGSAQHVNFEGYFLDFRIGGVVPSQKEMLSWYNNSLLKNADLNTTIKNKELSGHTYLQMDLPPVNEDGTSLTDHTWGSLYTYPILYTLSNLVGWDDGAILNSSAGSSVDAVIEFEYDLAHMHGPFMVGFSENGDTTNLANSGYTIFINYSSGDFYTRLNNGSSILHTDPSNGDIMRIERDGSSGDINVFNKTVNPTTPVRTWAAASTNELFLKFLIQGDFNSIQGIYTEINSVEVTPLAWSLLDIDVLSYETQEIFMEAEVLNINSLR